MTRITVIKENTCSLPKFHVATRKQSRPEVLSHDLLESSRQLNDVATEKRSRNRNAVKAEKVRSLHRIEVATPIPRNKKNEVTTNILTADK